jgi:hypothetical protein
VIIKKQERTLFFLGVFSLSALAAGLTAAPNLNANAATSTGSAIVTTNVGAVINMSVDNINVNLSAPSPSGIFATGTGKVNVQTNDPSGYSVFLTSNTTTTSLNHDTVSSASIASISSKQTISGTTTKFSTMNTWGWSNDGKNFFAVQPKGQLNNQTAGSTTRYRNTTAASTSVDTSTLTIGVTGNSSLVAGQYTGTLLLTAIPNSNTTEIANYNK